MNTDFSFKLLSLVILAGMILAIADPGGPSASRAGAGQRPHSTRTVASLP